MATTIFNSKKAGGLSDLEPGESTPGQMDDSDVEIPTPYTEVELNNIATEIITALGDQYFPYADYYNKCLEIYINGGYNTLFFQDVWEVLVEQIPMLRENQNTEQSGVSSSNVSKIWTGTMDEYDALEAYDNSIIYFITEGQI